MGLVIRRFYVSHIAILGGRLGEPGAERERVPDQVRSIRARVNPRRPNGLVTRDHDASSQPAEAWMYYSPVTKSITTNVQRWRIYTEQRSLNLWMGVCSFSVACCCAQREILDRTKGPVTHRNHCMTTERRVEASRTRRCALIVLVVSMLTAQPPRLRYRGLGRSRGGAFLFERGEPSV